MAGKQKKIEFEIDENGCFVCTSHYIDKLGYPRFRWNGNAANQMSRFIYEQSFGEIPKGLVVRHKCDNRACINPNHLELGTSADNSKDMVERERQAKGEKNANSKLKEHQVIEIKKLILEGRTSKEIAENYNVSRCTINDIKFKRHWTFLKVSGFDD